jgi:N-methylhydantoinase A
MRQTIEEFREKARSELADQGLDPSRALIEASVDLRFHGQSYEIGVPARGDLARAFRREHRRRYGYASRTERIELVTIRLVVRVPRPIPRPRPPSSVVAVGPQSRRVLFDDGWQEIPVHERGRLGPGMELEGPAIVSEDHATTLVSPGSRLAVDRSGLLEISVGA